MTNFNRVVNRNGRRFFAISARVHEEFRGVFSVVIMETNCMQTVVGRFSNQKEAKAVAAEFNAK